MKVKEQYEGVIQKAIADTSVQAKITAIIEDCKTCWDKDEHSEHSIFLLNTKLLAIEKKE